MSADLRQVNTLAVEALSTKTISSQLSKTIAALYVFVLLTVSMGTAFALYQNWMVRLELANSRLVRNAHMGNFLIETALNSAAKSLDNTQLVFSQVLQRGSIEPALAGKLLRTSYAKFQAYNKTDLFGLMFYVDSHGQLLAQSDGTVNAALDLTDRQYFYQLLDNPGMQRTVGPLVFSRTTAQWVFHMSVPVVGKNGRFAGVLVQQILENDIAKKLRQYIDPQHFEFLVTHFDGSDPSFVFPPPDVSTSPPPNFLKSLTRRQGSDERDVQPTPHMLMGFAKSEVYDLRTYATLPKSTLRQEFIAANRYLLLYALIGIAFSTLIFFYLYGLSKQLKLAQLQSLHDPLTLLHNRRALDESLPILLRLAKRTQKPISVLFIDIDHFRFFNENYGHESGDVALQAVAKALQSCARRPMDFVCRWGGEEFVVVLPDTDRHAAIDVADDMLQAIRRIDLQAIHGDHPRLTISIGHVTQASLPDDSKADLIDLADKAMLEAKTQGRDCRVGYEAAELKR